MKVFFPKLSVIISSFFFGSLVLAQSPSLFTEGGIEAILSTKDSFAIEVSDQVSDGCLPHPSALQDKLEIALRKNGFGITKEQFLSNLISIKALGYAIDSANCAVTLSTTLSFFISSQVPFALGMPGGSNTFHVYEYRIAGVLLTGPKNEMQARLENQTTQAADKLFLDISRARDEIFSKFPDLKSNYEARE